MLTPAALRIALPGQMVLVHQPGVLQQKDVLHTVTYPISAPPQVKEQIAPGSLLSSRTLAIILGRKSSYC